MSWNSLARKAIKLAALPYGAVSRRRRGDLAILLYHRIGDGPAEIELTASVFERQLAALRAREKVLTLDRALTGSAGGVVVTFDDGYRDFCERAVPLLVRHRVPAMLYLATSLVANGAGPAGADALGWSDLADALGTGMISVGAHTHGHTDLSRAGEGEAEQEMRRSKELIEDHLGVPCRHFAYPWAVASPAADRIARRLFDSAALHAWRTNRGMRLDPWRLGRVPILKSDGQVFFHAKVRGLLDGEAFAYRALGRGPWSRL